MTGDPRTRPIDVIASDRTPRAWITAGRPLHPLLIEAAADLADANLVISGRKAEATVPFSALERALDGGRDLSARITELSPWVIITEPHWLDPETLTAVSRAADTGTAIVVMASDSESGMSDLRNTLAPRERRFAEPWFGDADVEAWAAAQIGRELADSAVTELIGAAGPSSHVLGLLVSDAARREMRMPGGGDTITTGGEAMTGFVTHALADVSPSAALAVGLSAITSTPLPVGHRSEAFAAGLADARGRLIPAVGDAVVASLDDVARRDLAESVWAAHASGSIGDDETARAFLVIDRAPPAASRLVAGVAGREASFDPIRALHLLDLIPETPERLETRMQALALGGRVTDAAGVADRILAIGPSPRASLVTAAGLAAAARFEVAAGAYEASDPEDRLRIGAQLLGAPVRAAIGQKPSLTGSNPGSVTAAAVSTFADGALELIEGRSGALALLQDGAELAATSDATLWPDTPHTLAAVALTLDFDHDRAARLITHGIEHDVGGAAHRARHRLVRGLVALREGRWSDAEGAIADLSETPLALRDRLALIGMQIALARRAGDVSTLERHLEPGIELVVRHPIDLISLPAHCEIAVALARMGATVRAEGLLDQIDDFASALPERPWRTHAAWTRTVAGLLASRQEWLETGTARLGPPLDPLSPIMADLASAPLADVTAAVELLEGIGQIHEAGLVASAAALGRSDDSRRPLITTASRLRGLLPGRGIEAASGLESLSDRELEVAREIIDGRRYKEIGERLFISAKTVEHHVAHIKTKLGASSRSEMISALRQALG